MPPRKLTLGVQLARAAADHGHATWPHWYHMVPPTGQWSLIAGRWSFVSPSPPLPLPVSANLLLLVQQAAAEGVLKI